MQRTEPWDRSFVVAPEVWCLWREHESDRLGR